MDRNLGELVQETADRLAGRHGAVVGAVAGGAVEIRGAGRTGKGDVPDAHAVFEIGSVTKVFTALALARQVVAGAVDLDEPVRALLPEGTDVPSRDGREIALRHLAAHTSGLPRLPKGARPLLRPSPDPYAGYTADRVLAGLAGTRLRAAPGERFRYSNLGAGLLGLALAGRAGTDYGSLVARDVCAPLGLTSTAVAPAGRLVQGHDRRGRPTVPWNMAALAGAGALRSTATDLVAFARAQFGGGELADAIALTHRVEHRAGRWRTVHLGWLGLTLHARLGGHHQLWHNGGTGGFASFVGLIPERKAAVVVLRDVARPVDQPALALLRALA